MGWDVIVPTAVVEQEMLFVWTTLPHPVLCARAVLL